MTTPPAHHAQRTALLIPLLISLVLPLLGAACGEVVIPTTDECARAWQPVALQNPGFDEGSIGWVDEPPDQPVIFQPDPADFQPHSAPFIARLGATNLLAQTLAQELELPAGTTRIRLRGQRCIESDEMDPAVPKDTMNIALHDTATGALLAELAQWDNGDGGALCQWSSFAEEQALFNLTANLPANPPTPTNATPARLSFHSVLDDLYITSFNIDTLALEVFACAE